MSGPRWWGSRGHVWFTVIVFVCLASLDNAALATIPNMVLPIARDLDTSETAIGALTAVVILVTAVTAVLWGYLGDRSSRKRLLLYGTVVWSVGAALSGTAESYRGLFAWQFVAAIGLGSIASVGFSVISDFVAPARRGLAMSFWGISQGIGGTAGGVLASQLGATNFRIPLFTIAALGAVFGLLYLVTFDAPRGYREPALDPLHERGGHYDYRIEPAQVPQLLHRRTNRWLVLQGFTAQFAYGSLIWVPLLFQEKVIDQGYSVATGTRVGGLFAAIFQIGALLSIVAGHLGDRWQARSPRGRATLSAIGILGAIPFFIAFFFVPLRSLDLTDGAGSATLITEVVKSLITNPWVMAAFALSLIAAALTSADSPNWFALISDVNLPEHRGTVFGLGNLSNGLGRALGNVLTGVTARAIERSVPPPLNWAIGLSAFQAYFLPTGYCYWKAAGTSPADIAEVSAILAERAMAKE